MRAAVRARFFAAGVGSLGARPDTIAFAIAGVRWRAYLGKQRVSLFSAHDSVLDHYFESMLLSLPRTKCTARAGLLVA